MIHGIDTGFLVQFEVSGHPRHAQARRCLEELISRGDELALCPQVLTEFVHVITDPRRFTEPLPMAGALARATLWWNAPEVVPVFPDAMAVGLALEWMEQFRLGRKRILDTFLAATYRCVGVQSLLSSDTRDFTVFDAFLVIRV